MASVLAYVDGFNLYHGLKARLGRKYLWLDLHTLAKSLLRPDQSLAQITYFTARIRSDPERARRQTNYIDALSAHSPLLEVRDGHFQEKGRRCRACGTSWVEYEEKETDVNIALALLEDGVADRYDTALLISADSDLCPAIRSIRRLRPDKRVIAAFPPRRYSRWLQQSAHGFLYIPDSKIRAAQLRDEVVTLGGTAIKRPVYWS